MNVSKTGGYMRRGDKSIKFSDLKDLNMKIAKKLNESSLCPFGLTLKLEDCCMEMALYKDLSTGELRLHRHRCKDRFCPICQHVRSGNIATFLTQDYERTKDTDMFYSLVLTVKSCDIDHLCEYLKQLSKSFTLFKNYIYRCHTSIKAYCRTIEFTYNSETGLFHPHIHVLFNFGLKDRSRAEEIINYDYGTCFAKYLPDDYSGYKIPTSDVYSEAAPLIRYCREHGIDPNTIKQSVVYQMTEYDPERASMFEFSKYITKFNDLLQLDPDTFYKVYQATAKLPPTMMGGTWRKWKEKIEFEDGSLYIDRQSIIQNANLVLLGYVGYKSTTNFILYTKRLGIRRPFEMDDGTEFLYDRLYHRPKLE